MDKVRANAWTGGVPHALRRRLALNLVTAAGAAATLIAALLWTNAHGLASLLLADPQALMISVFAAALLAALFAVLAFAVSLADGDGV